MMEGKSILIGISSQRKESQPHVIEPRGEHKTNRNSREIEVEFVSGIGHKDYISNEKKNT